MKRRAFATLAAAAFLASSGTEPELARAGASSGTEPELARADRIPRVMVWFPTRYSPDHARQQVRAVIERTPISAIHIDTVQAALLVPGSEAEHDILAGRVRAFVRAAVDEARDSCVRIGLDFDWDRALPEYEKRHPDETFSRLHETELTLDSSGRATATVRSPTGIRRLATDFPAVRSGVHRVYAYTPSGDGYAPGSLADLTAKATGTEDGANGVSVQIDAGAEQAGKRVLLMTRHEYRHPDMFGEGLEAFQREILRTFRGTGVGLADLDELGLPNEPQNFQDIISGEALKDLWRTPWFSDGLKARYERATGRDYERDLLHQRFPPADDPGARTRAIAAYYDTLRTGVAGLERAFYDEAKRSLGPDVFVGVHPTWYALYPSVTQFEYQRNGLHWWEVRRDYAQVDEGVIQPVKLALGRRWDSPVTTTMVYGPNFETFLDAAYAEARWNGRVDYDGSAGTDGPESLGTIIVNTMSGSRPEQIAAVEERVTLLDDAARSLPKPSALVVFGYYSGASWTTSNPDGGSWDLVEPQGNTTNSAMELARALTDQGWTVDLVPSTEVDAGRVSVDANGNATYAGRTYPAAVLAHPDLSKPATLDWAERIGRLGLVGDMTTDADGRDVTVRWAALKARADATQPGVPLTSAPVFFQAGQYGFPTGNQAATLAARQLATALGLEADPIADGNLLEDGTVVITDGSRYDPSTPSLSATVNGRRVDAEGASEFFAVRLDGAGRIDRLAGDRLRAVRVDGEEVLRFDKPYDLALRRVGERWSLTYRGTEPTDPFLRSIEDSRSIQEARCTRPPDTTAPRVRFRKARHAKRSVLVRWRAGDAVAFDVRWRVGRGAFRERHGVDGPRRLRIRARRGRRVEVRVAADDLAGNRSREAVRRFRRPPLR